MANPSGDQGTRFETKIAREADERPLLEGQRAPNNMPGRDVEIRLYDGTMVPHEAKDRANLNVHKLLAEVARKQDGYPPIVVWARKSRKGDNERRSPDGPATAAMPVTFWLDVLEVLSAVSVAAPELLDELRASYPKLAR